MQPHSRKKLGELLLHRNLISPEALALAVAEQTRSHQRLGEILFERQLVPREALVRAIEDLVRCPHFDSSNLRPDPEILQLIPEALARKHLCLPVRRNGRYLEAVFAEPQDLSALDEVSFASGMQVRAFMDFRSSLTKAIDRLHGEASEPALPIAQGAAEDDQIEYFSASSRQAHKEAMVELTANLRGETTEAVRLLNQIMATALEKRASDIHLEQQLDQLVVRLRIDGILRELERLTSEFRGQLISRVKILADLDIAERRLPQDGRFLSRRRGRCYDVRVSTLPTHFGEKVVLRILDPKAAAVPFEQLGFSPHDAQTLTDLVHLPQGMILVTGPTGSGKSTTLYSALNLIRSSAINITTIEDPIEYVIEGANQVQVDLKAGRSFASCLRSMLRQDPNVVMVGEIRDPETAEIALTGAQTGHLLFSSLHTNDAASAISRLIDLNIPPFFIASSVNAILAQRLVRKLCRCRRESGDTDALRETLAAMGYPHQPVAAYSPVGCALCDQTGYKGRIGVYELLLLDDRIRQAIRNNVRDEVLRDFAVSAGMHQMIDDAVSKVLQGVTTLEEILRVVPNVKRLAPSCSHCNTPLNPRFRYCPYCATVCNNTIPLGGEHGAPQPQHGSL